MDSGKNLGIHPALLRPRMEDEGGQDAGGQGEEEEGKGEEQSEGSTLGSSRAGTRSGELSWATMTMSSMMSGDRGTMSGDRMWTEDLDSLGDGYYTRQEVRELAVLVAREREEQRHVELSSEHVRKWIKCARACRAPRASCRGQRDCVWLAAGEWPVRTPPEGLALRPPLRPPLPPPADCMLPLSECGRRAAGGTSLATGRLASCRRPWIQPRAKCLPSSRSW